MIHVTITSVHLKVILVDMKVADTMKKNYYNLDITFSELVKQK